MDFNIKLSDGTVLRGFIVSPGTSTSAFVILVHGLGEHVGRYREWAMKFRENGIGFAAVDLPGHGKSEGKRGHIRSYYKTDEMIGILLEEYRKIFPGIPVFLYGHSLGGGIVLRYLLKNKPKIRGAIVTSPWIRLSFEPSKGKITLAGIMKHIMPSLVQPTGLATEHLSRLKEVVDRYINDPLVHDRISVTLFHSAVSTAAYILNNAGSLNVPVLLYHGSDDRITSPEGSSELASKSGMINFRLWEGGYHELHNEPFKEQVFSSIADWITDRVS